MNKYHSVVASKDANWMCQVISFQESNVQRSDKQSMTRLHYTTRSYYIVTSNVQVSSSIHDGQYLNMMAINLIAIYIIDIFRTECSYKHTYTYTYSKITAISSLCTTGREHFKMFTLFIRRAPKHNLVSDLSIYKNDLAWRLLPSDVPGRSLPTLLCAYL